MKIGYYDPVSDKVLDAPKNSSRNSEGENFVCRTRFRAYDEKLTIDHLEETSDSVLLHVFAQKELIGLCEACMKYLSEMLPDTIGINIEPTVIGTMESPCIRLYNLKANPGLQTTVVVRQLFSKLRAYI